MAHPLLLLGLLGATSIGTNGALLRAAAHSPDLKPTIGGFDARAVLGALGLGSVVLGALIGGPILGAGLGTIGTGLLFGAVTNVDTVGVVKGGFEEAVKRYIAAQGGGALPGPASPPIDDGTHPDAPRPSGGDAGMFSWLYS